MDRRSRIAASVLALVAAVSIWLSLGTLAIAGGDTSRIAALPSLTVLLALCGAAVVVAQLARLRLEHAWPLAVSLLIWLPYLPGVVPSVFLIWQGPLEVAVWLAVVVGMVAGRPAAAVPRALGSPALAPLAAAAIVLITSLAVFSQVRGVIPGGDEPHYLAATQSLLQDADLRIENNYAAGDYLDYFPGRLEPHFLKRSMGGEIYSIHAPGVSAVVLPAFAVAGYVGAVFTIALIAALSAMVTWRVAFRLSSSAAGAWAGTAAVFLTAPYFFHTFTIYPEVIGGFCVLCGVWLLLEVADGREPSTRRLLAVGAALALLPWLHTRLAVIAGVLGVILVIRLAGRPRAMGRIAALLAVPVVAGAGWLAFFYLIWGSPNPAAPYGPDTSTSASYVLRGLVGLLVDQQFGLLITAPVLVVAVAGSVLMFRQQPRLTFELAMIVIPYAITVASYAMWWAGSAAPARFLVSVLPLAALPIAVFWKAHRSTGVAILLVISVALILPRALVEGGRLIVNSRGTTDGTLMWLSSIIDLPLGLPSVHRDGGTVAIRDAALWLALLATAVLPAAFRGWPQKTYDIWGQPPVAWTVSALAFAIATTTAVGVVGAFHGAVMTTPDRSRLAAVGAYRPWLHETLVDLQTRRSLAADEFLAAMSIDMVTPAVRLNRVPAGDYEVRVTTPPASPVPLAMFIGRNDPPIEAPLLDDLRDGRAPFLLRLPVAVQTLNLTARGDVGAGQPQLTLRPVRPAVPAVEGNALRAARYGHARVFVFDDWAYLEPDGFWTRANGSTTVVIDTNDATRLAGLPISITAGAVPTTIRLSTGGWERSVSLEPGAKQDVVLPPADANTWTVRVRSGAGFRPFEREPGNRDVRELAAWIAIQ
ncbi:MAG: hypothetical protein FJW22_01080 [Acidimicrobiia bacterium]|nr:hypothetical protein [Acidimicrobiia bacterium]